MIDALYANYFQKSNTFLYPLLGFNKNNHVKPHKTYLCSEDIGVNDCKIICQYTIEDNDKWKKFERDFLITHKMLFSCEKINNNTILYIFDLLEYIDDYNSFLNGKYSKFSKEAKSLILSYYGIKTPEWVYVESFLFPEKYYKIYAHILNEDEELIKKTGELCDKYCLTRETFDSSKY